MFLLINYIIKVKYVFFFIFYQFGVIMVLGKKRIKHNSQYRVDHIFQSRIGHNVSANCSRSDRTAVIFKIQSTLCSLDSFKTYYDEFPWKQKSCLPAGSTDEVLQNQDNQRSNTKSQRS